ncbi:hypothetical protein D7Z54_33170 [Salibacterium salarium]|uniref:Uncharacterized protein n=1 Tax=Salibacterium salarium TaxID=284579 RepID=A0A428MSD4_9BACI|nr:hypothetical protein [Salibacterium salarium]RSL29083.1 hypothetical protein D7Z54_33170 [Salibacterium salarium]
MEKVHLDKAVEGTYGLSDDEKLMSVHEKVDAFIEEKSNERRVAMYAIEAKENESLRLQVNSLSNEVWSAISKLDNYEGLSDMVKRETKAFFSPYFAGFDNGAAVAFGVHFKNALNYITNQEGSIQNRGKAEHLVNLTMEKLIEKSRAKFFQRLKTSDSLRDEFRRVFSSYAYKVWQMKMDEYGTLTSDSVLHERAKASESAARTEVVRFVEENMRISKGMTLSLSAVYGEYEKWAENNEHTMVGKSSFTVEVTASSPGIHYTPPANGYEGFFTGLAMPTEKTGGLYAVSHSAPVSKKETKETRKFYA